MQDRVRPGSLNPALYGKSIVNKKNIKNTSTLGFYWFEDPKYPVENLLNPDSHKGPWLSCPQDKSGQLKAELQLERVVPISYIDVGNCGCAFLQIDVGRSSWPPDRPFVTLLPATMLMSPAEAKEEKNRSGVRMFRADDFLAPASGESWDRLRLTCSQPFTRRQSFGLAFLRVRSPVDPSAEPVIDPLAPGGSGLNWSSSDALESDPRPWLTNPSIRRTFFPEPHPSPEDTPELKGLLRQLQPGPPGRAARMLLSAAQKAPAASVIIVQLKFSAKSEGGSKSKAKTAPTSDRKPQWCPGHRTVSHLYGLLQHRDSSLTCRHLWRELPTPASLSLLVLLDIGAVRVLPRKLPTVFLGPPQPSWTEIVNKKLRFPPTLLGAIQEGQLGLVQQLLEAGADASGAGPGGPLRNVEESEDRSWREALNLAIRLGHEAITDVLLANIKFDFRQVHEALLVAVDTNQPAVVRRLLARLDREKGRKVDTKSFSLAFFDSSIDGSRFAPGVTPLTLACQKDLYEIAQLLMDQGHTIARPHPVSCACLECSNARRYDLLKFSLSRINTYRGIASRAHLSLASEDAMLAAFQLSRELKRLARKEPEFKPQYIGLESLCQDYGFELLGMCRNQSEVTAVLNDLGEDSETEPEAEGLGQAFEEGIPNLARLRLAVNYNQKQFVAHPICQQVLSSIWCGNLAGWRGSTTIWKLFVAFLIFLTMPFLCIGYWLAPKSRLGRLLKVPVLKFLLHSASYLWFLIFLLGESLVMETQLSTFKGRSQSVWETSLHMIWVTGFLWFECKEVWIEGLRSYLLDWWNFLDVVILSLYLASFALRLLLAGLAYMHCQEASDSATCHYFTAAERSEWRTEDPQFLAEVLFAVTSMLSFTRLAYILPAHESLGTLQISIGRMIDDMIRFNETFQFLFWTMFGMEEHNVVDMPQFLVPEFVGRALYGIFTIVMVIVLLNMLIAMITNSFQKIEDDADVEWKFARSKLYLSYFREGLTLPVPFNILPSPKAAFYLLRRIFWFVCCCSSCCKAKKSEYPAIPTFTNPGAREGPGEGERERGSYRLRVIKALVQRYIETARREFEETRRKDLGTRLTELTKTVSRLQSEVVSVQKTLAAGGAPRPPDGASILSRYITRVRNSFQNLGPPTPETPAELTMPGIVETEVSLGAGLDAIGEAETPASGESSHASPAHVLVHREQEAEGAGDLPLEEGLETKGES
ncbi:Short transient receptor potential channel 2 [Microtus ochrogaster]|uniref:Short transient receptor potential channel 2 n=1 Tax=Microtus ochrogaster TaxID=79684 RepID=A0A8J6GQ83_MICOH|nr:Short transient receptor potential channel 2 [Microtus ochrogaster]